MRRAPAPETAQHVAAAILRLETETTNSQFLMVDGDPHLFSAFTRKLLPLNHGDARWATHLLMVYGLNTKDREITPKVTQALASYAMYNGPRPPSGGGLPTATARSTCRATTARCTASPAPA